MIDVLPAPQDHLLLRRRYFVACPAATSALPWWRSSWRETLRQWSAGAPAGSAWTVQSSLSPTDGQERDVIDELEALTCILGGRHRLRLLVRCVDSRQLQRVLDAAPPGVRIALELDLADLPHALAGCSGVEMVMVRVTGDASVGQLREAIEQGWEHALPVGALVEGGRGGLMDTIREVEGFAEIVLVQDSSPHAARVARLGGRVSEVAA